jgi:hypothetical protein
VKAVGHVPLKLHVCSTQLNSKPHSLAGVTLWRIPQIVFGYAIGRQ